MAISYYGFDFGGYPKTSRLFNQDVLDKAQQAYNTGMQQFTPYPTEAAPVEQAPVVNPLSPNAWLANLPNGYGKLSDAANVTREQDGNFMVTVPSANQRGMVEQFFVDQYGNLKTGKQNDIARDVSTLSPAQMDAYNRLMAQMRMGSNA